MQHSAFNVRRRSEIFNTLGVGSAKLLIRNVKNERMLRPQLVVLENKMPGNRAEPITRKHDRFYFIWKTHSRSARYPLRTCWQSRRVSANCNTQCNGGHADWLFDAATFRRDRAFVPQKSSPRPAARIFR